MNERFPSTARKAPEEFPEPGSANDSEFNLNDQVTDYVVSNIPKDDIQPFPLYDVNAEPTIADVEFAKIPLKPRLTRADFEPKAFLGTQLEAQAASPDVLLNMETVVADDEFAKHERLTPYHFTKAGIEEARRAAQGISENNTPSQHYIDTNIAGRINTNQEVPKVTKPARPSEEFSETKVAPKYNVTIHESVRATTPKEYNRPDNLINPNAIRLNRNDFPEGTPIYIPPRPEPVILTKPSFFKRLVPKFIAKFFN